MPPRRLERHLAASPEALVARVDQQRPGEIAGDTVPTGFPSVDRLLGGGLRRRGLIVLGGDVGSGKSALARGIALRVAQQGGGLGVAFFSGEMDEERLMERALAVEGRVAVDELRAAKLTDQTRGPRSRTSATWARSNSTRTSPSRSIARRCTVRATEWRVPPSCWS